MSEKTVSEAINYRRSVRVYDNEKPIDSAVVKKMYSTSSISTQQ